MAGDRGMEKVQAVKTLLNEQKSNHASPAGYPRCKAAVRKLGLTVIEQMHVLLALDFASFIKRDPAFEVHYNRHLTELRRPASGGGSPSDDGDRHPF